MYGSLPNNDQLKVFRPTPRGMRKIVISTNIAETSITINGIVYGMQFSFYSKKNDKIIFKIHIPIMVFCQLWTAGL